MATLAIVKISEASSNSTALLLTGEAQNMLCMQLAESSGVIIKSPWVAWFKDSCFPALASLMLTPLIVYKNFPPKQSTPRMPVTPSKIHLRGFTVRRVTNQDPRR
ncbi:putative solute carrier family 13 [Helianthus annuus]|uniref:Solute carrier family 13 n=1 Tax=Helianthus annuus TaxID=4232 RepID=A0A9K3DZL0_HELAN|nr:putative solute carrier family 13 [Helianthus annuus]